MVKVLVPSFLDHFLGLLWEAGLVEVIYYYLCFDLGGMPHACSVHLGIYSKYCFLSFDGSSKWYSL